MNVLIAAIHEWHIRNFHRWNPPNGIKKHLISDRKDLTLEKLEELDPQYIFFPHWSWIIPAEILDKFKCVIFHMTDLPFGRGGSPLQNLIERGIYRTQVSAIMAVSELDAGPVYLKYSMDIYEGSALEIYENFSDISFRMIDQILKNNIVPKPQEGEVAIFKRRSPDLSRIPSNLSPRQLYDFIRMLDAPGYPRAFIEHHDLKIRFYNANLVDEKVIAEVEVSQNE
jgi:methionyl-tRNA formyltransferase